MAKRTKKPWNAGKDLFPGLDGREPVRRPEPNSVTVGHSTGHHMSANLPELEPIRVPLPSDTRKGDLIVGVVQNLPPGVRVEVTEEQPGRTYHVNFGAVAVTAETMATPPGSNPLDLLDATIEFRELDDSPQLPPAPPEKD